MAPKPNSNDRTRRELQTEAKIAAQKFGFEPASVAPCKGSNNAFRVSVQSSNGKNFKVFLKCKKASPDFEFWIYDQLQSEGIELIPEFHESADAKRTVVLESGNYWTCQKFIVSEYDCDWLKFDCDSEHAFRAGEALAKFHEFGAQMISKLPQQLRTNNTNDLFQSFPKQFASSIEKFKKCLKTIAEPEIGTAGSIRRQIFEVIVRQALAGAPWLEICAGPMQVNNIGPEEVEQECARRLGRAFGANPRQALPGKPPAENSIRLLQNLPWDDLLKRAHKLSDHLLSTQSNCAPTINHGDFHPGNLLFSKTELIAVVDWEFACIGSPAYDLSYALFMFCLNPLVESQGEPFNLKKTEVFLDAYTTASRNAEISKELKNYSDFVHLLILDWVCNELCKTDSIYTGHEGFLHLSNALWNCCTE